MREITKWLGLKLPLILLYVEALVYKLSNSVKGLSNYHELFLKLLIYTALWYFCVFSICLLHKKLLKQPYPRVSRLYVYTYVVTSIVPIGLIIALIKGEL